MSIPSPRAMAQPAIAPKAPENRLGSGGHFLYVAGLNPDGSCDPWRPEITRMNDGELDHFAHNRAGQGGMIEIWR